MESTLIYYKGAFMLERKSRMRKSGNFVENLSEVALVCTGGNGCVQQIKQISERFFL